MKHRVHVFSLVVLLASGVLADPVHVSAAQGISSEGRDQKDPQDLRQQHQYLVVAKDDLLTRRLRSSIVPDGAAIVREMTDIGVAVVETRDPQFSSKMSRNESVLGVIEDTEVRLIPDPPAFVPVDTRNDRKTKSGSPQVCPDLDLDRSEYVPWNIRQIRADVVFAPPKASRRVKVAVLDSGINVEHVDLSSNIEKSLSRSFVPSEPSIEDLNSHGSHVAGIIAARRNGRGVQGVAPDAGIVALKVLDANGNGKWSSIFEALRYAATIKADVVNMSFGQGFDVVSDETLLLKTTLDRAIKKVRANGAVVVTSSGNNALELGAGTFVLPAQAKNVVTVSATGPIEGSQFDRLASYSNYGRDVIDIAAPGGDFVSERTYPCDMILSAAARTGDGPNQWRWEAGTSMAAPHVAGVVALVKSRFEQMHPQLAERWIERTSSDISTKGRDAQSGWGRVDAARATSGFWPRPSRVR
jgi:hypothetical protein